MGRSRCRNCRLLFMLVITAGFFVVELVVGHMGNSLALVSDSFNMLSDLISLVIGLLAATLGKITRHPRNTYGFARAEVVGALANAVFLTALTFTILVEAIIRLIRPQRIDDVELVLMVGALGLAVNIIGLILFQDCCFKRQVSGSPTGYLATDAGEQRENKAPATASALNIRGVFLHVMGDALGSVVVVVAATIFYILPLNEDEFCNWKCYVDPSMTIIMVIIVLLSAFPLIKETAVILLQMLPRGIKLHEFDEKLCAVDGVHGIHELHIWELAGGRHIATLHVKCLDLSSYETAALQIREIFHNAGIHSVTIQAEFVDTVPGSTLKCNFPCVRKECENKMCCISQNDCNLDAEGSIEMRNNSPGPSRNGFMGNNAAEDNVEELSILPSYDLTTTKQKEGKEATNGLSHLHSTSL
ncbi:zinc transporter 10-like isoform X1 [Chiloscyllium plagiosum]|uniref:zinc transporter 10-like isoform X1 n=1 Tax=Chiloscyllium plagiosum TaxID=36176 RepID=UPI001CB7E4E7|nr:zinc transporter 10-like isoform X1 [Chiloscyllium plagiosum]